jgi:hypothetical protein
MPENSPAIVNKQIIKRKKPTFNDEQRKIHCKEYKDSELSIKEYCELNKISESALRKWMHKLPSKVFFEPVSSRSSINNFNKQTFEIIFPNSIRLRFPELVDLGVIKQLMKEVGSCS